MTDSVWVYAVASKPVSLEGVRGVAGETVRALPIEGLVAVVGSVPGDEFDEAGLTRKLEDLDWLGTAARAHDAVLRQLPSPIVPFRLATVYSDESAAIKVLSERLSDLVKAIESVRGRVELGVSGFSAPTVEPSSKPERRSGRDYLMSRKRELEQSQRSGAEATRAAETVHAALSEIAVSSRTKRPQDPTLTRGEPMIYNGTFLVDESRIDEFEACVEACRQKFT